MKIIPAHRKCQATAWVVLALGVSGAFIILRRSGTTASAAVVSEPTNRVFKSRTREAIDHPSARSAAEMVPILASRRPSAERDQTLIQAVSQWADEAPVEAMAWLADFPQGELRDWLTCSTVTAISEHDPVKAASFLEIELPDGLPRNHAIVAVAQRWAQQSPDDARHWVERLGPTNAQADALREIAVMETRGNPISLSD